MWGIYSLIKFQRVISRLIMSVSTYPIVDFELTYNQSNHDLAYYSQTVKNMTIPGFYGM